MSEHTPAPRHRRNNPKRKKDEEIYCYDTFEKEGPQAEDSEEDNEEEVS